MRDSLPARSGRAGFIVVVDNVHTHTFASIATITRPVVENVATHVDQFLGLRAGACPKTGRTALMVSQKIVMK